MQLKSAEQTQKDDQSPVTIADYGAPQIFEAKKLSTIQDREWDAPNL